MEPETMNVMGHGIYRAVLTMIQTLVLAIGLASISFLIACFVCALLGNFAGKDRPARLPAQSEDRCFVGSPASIHRAQKEEGVKG
jgi:hypothetical protein